MHKYYLLSSFGKNVLHYNTVPNTLNTQDIKFNSQKLSLTYVSFLSSDMLAMLLEMLMTRPPPPRRSVLLHFLLDFFNHYFLLMLSHTGGKLYLPQSLLRLGLRAQIYMASFTLLSNHLGSVASPSVFSNSIECWG